MRYRSALRTDWRYASAVAIGAGSGHMLNMYLARIATPAQADRSPHEAEDAALLISAYAIATIGGRLLAGLATVLAGGPSGGRRVTPPTRQSAPPGGSAIGVSGFVCHSSARRI